MPSQATELTRKAWRLARKEQVHVPAIWQPEFVNVLSVLERRGLLERHQVDSAISKVERLGIEVHGSFRALAPLIDVVRRHAIKAYDASYLHVAVSMRAPLYLVDGRSVSVPLAWSWRLSEATPAQRDHWELIGDGICVHWPEVDEDISIEGMLHGTPAPRPTAVL